MSLAEQKLSSVSCFPDALLDCATTTQRADFERPASFSLRFIKGLNRMETQITLRKH